MTQTRTKTSWLSIILLALLMCFFIGLFVSPLFTVRINSIRSKSANNVRSIVLCALVYANDHNGLWPKDLAELRQQTQSLNANIFRAPGDPTVANPYCYVRPVTTAISDQPVLVEDPTCEHGTGSIVCYADGHITYSHNLQLWNQARRLAALPKTAREGVDGHDWGLVPVSPR
jgi:prepilin-type processing-associated H-X9-DG protein